LEAVHTETEKRGKVEDVQRYSLARHTEGERERERDASTHVRSLHSLRMPPLILSTRRQGALQSHTFYLDEMQFKKKTDEKKQGGRINTEQKLNIRSASMVGIAQRFCVQIHCFLKCIFRIDCFNIVTFTSPKLVT